MNSSAPSPGEESEERIPFLSELDKLLLRRWVFTGCMMLCIIGAIVGVATSLGYSNEHAPAGGLTLLWRVPLAVLWDCFGFFCYYKLMKYWGRTELQWVDNLMDKIRRRR